MIKRLIAFALLTLGRLARRLLHRAPKVVSETVLYALTIYAVGCVIPTPLDRQPGATNFAPSIDVDQTQPPLGPITRTSDSRWAWHVAATDPNIDDTLSAVIMERLGNGSFIFVADVNMTKLSILDVRQPARWSGDTALSLWCTLLKSGVHYLYAFVSDQMFIDSTEKSDGLVTSNHWELTCS
jgi:hypothetical protein